MTAKEVMAFWADFLREHDIQSVDVREAGEQLIAEDPEYWADRSMWDLLDRQPYDWATREEQS